MRRFFNIFAAVATLFAVSCTTDVTEDLGVNIGQGQTSITLSLEESRTQLGEKTDGVYPLYWSEGDKIAVNGITSSEAQIDQENKAKAGFTFQGEVARPYNVVYPAPAEGVVATTENTYPVTFLATQNYTAGTFESGAAPMYGYAATEGDAIAMQHLAGVLRFAPKGEGVVLTSITVKSESGKIAGNFDLDCVEGTLTPQADASNSINVSFGNGLALGAEATPIYVAIPAGEYGIFEVVFSTGTSAMTVKFNSQGEKAIKAGIIREFTPFTYEANTEVSDIFEIYDEASLRQFAAIAADFFPRKSAKVTATIDMTGKEWTPIKNFGPYTFDGGKAEGFAIKGLSAPLFESTNATIQNVDLVNVNITETERKYSGSLVCLLQKGGSATNCSVSGSYTYNNTTLKMAGDTWAEYAIGGVIGRSEDAALNNLTNSANFSIVSICASISAKSYPAFGGVIGAIENSQDFTTNDDTSYTMLETPVYSNLINNGEVSYDGTHGATKIQPVIGGVIGHGRYVKIHNATNSGEINFNKRAFCAYLGGIIGATHDIDVDTIENTGAITIDAQLSWPYLGGTIGQVNASELPPRTITGAVNRGTFTTTTNAYLDSNACIGGVVGVFSSGCKTTMTNSHNHGVLDLDGTADVTKECRIGGIIGSSTVTLAENCSNNGNILMKYATGDTKVGGIAGLMQTDAAGTIQNCTNNAKVEVSSQKHTAYIMLGGVAGYNKKGTLQNVTNKGEVTLSGSTAGRGYISGVCGASEYGLTGLVNEGTVTITSSSNLVGLCFGGCVGYSKAAVKNSTNKATILYQGKTDMSTAMNADGSAVEKGNEVFCVGGVVGWSASSGNSGLTNDTTATLNIGGTFTTSAAKKYGYTSIGGVAGRFSSGTHSKMYNKGTLIFSCQVPNASWNEEPFVFGGCVGYLTGSFSEAHNTGDITFSGSVKSDEPLRLSGVYGRGSNTATHTYTNLSNSGTITVSGFSADHMLVSGINSYNTNSVYNNIVNKGDIIITETAKSTASIYVGGCFANPDEGMTATGPVMNSGDITVKGTAGGKVSVGGCSRAHKAVGMNTYVNTGNISVERPAETTFPIHVGGIASEATAAIDSAKCHCDIHAFGDNISYGWITSAARSEAVIATNCQIGGRHLGEYIAADDKYETTPINNSNYTDYIYGVMPDWSGVTAFDGCTHLPTKPTFE